MESTSKPAAAGQLAAEATWRKAVEAAKPGPSDLAMYAADAVRHELTPAELAEWERAEGVETDARVIVYGQHPREDPAGWLLAVIAECQANEDQIEHERMEATRAASALLRTAQGATVISDPAFWRMAFHAQERLDKEISNYLHGGRVEQPRKR